MKHELNIRRAEYDSSVAIVAMDLPHLSFAELCERIEKAGYSFYDGEREHEAAVFDPRGHNGPWIYLVGTRVEVSQWMTKEGDDRFDGTIEPTEMSLDDILTVASVLRRIVR